MFYIILAGVVVVAGVIGFVFGRKAGGAVDGKDEPYFATASTDELQDIQWEAQEALNERTQMRKGKVLNMMRHEAEAQGKLEECSREEVVAGITRADVEELLDVSEGTARKYLNILEEEGKIEQVGERGRGVRYVVGGG